jgi:hypothetical protein
MMSFFQRITGSIEYKHEDGSSPNGILYDVLKQYGIVGQITDEHWDSRYKYRVENGIRIVDMILQKHIPSHMSLIGNRILLSYEGQPITCYGCSTSGHLYNDCPKLKNRSKMANSVQTRTWAAVVQGETPTKGILTPPHHVLYLMHRPLLPLSVLTT